MSVGAQLTASGQNFERWCVMATTKGVQGSPYAGKTSATALPERQVGQAKGQSTTAIASGGLVDPGAVGKAAKKPAVPAAEVHLSDEAKNKAEMYQKALDIARATPDIREDKVDAIKKKIQNGTYQVDSGKIADAMIKDAFIEETLFEHIAETEGRG